MKKIDLTQFQDLNKNIRKNSYYSFENFESDVKTYIKAIKERRMLCVIKSVSSSGMSRVISFNSCERSNQGYNYRQYIAFFEALGYTEVKRTGTFRIHGCGMDMIFNTNYNIIHKLKSYGLITKQQCDKLSQMTPTVL